MGGRRGLLAVGLVDCVWCGGVSALNLPLIAVAIAVTLLTVPESRDDADTGRGLRDLDISGAPLTGGALGLLVAPLIETQLPAGVRAALFVGSALAAAGVVKVARTSGDPM